MLNKSRELFEEWNSNNVSYCHWKGNDHLMEGLEGRTDLDILLASDDREKGCSILEETGFVKFQSQYGSRYHDIEDWIGFDPSSGCLLHIHLHYALIAGHSGLNEYELPWNEYALKSRILEPISGVYIMNPNLELVCLYTRLILKANRSWVKSARRGDFHMDNHFDREINYIRQQVDWDCVREIASRYYGGDGPVFCDITRAKILDSFLFLKLYDIVNSKFDGKKRYHGLSLSIRKAFCPLAVSFRNKLKQLGNDTLIVRKVVSPQKGFSVAFIGQDGSGKSTLTEDIKKWLTWKIEANRFYLGSGDGYHSITKLLIERGVLLTNRVKGRNQHEKGKKSDSNGKKSFVTSIVVSWNMLMIARHSYRVMHKAEKYRNKGGISLLDRFPQMQFEGIYDGPRIADYCQKHECGFLLNRIMAKRELYYFSKIQKWQPTLVFKLLLSPEESIHRKPFEDIDNVRKKHKITRELSFPYSAVFEIDAAQDYQQELITVKSKIWETLFQVR